MNLKKDFSLLVVIVVISVAILACPVLASTTTFNVPSGEELTRTIDLNAEDHVTLTFTAVGGGTDNLHFYMVFPNGTTLDKGSIAQFKMNFVADVGGLFELHFDNNSTSTQLITLNYEIERYFFGLPAMIWLLMGIAVLLLFIATGYITMGKYGA
jgi:uncharacterized protein (UPF0333 family)